MAATESSRRPRRAPDGAAPLSSPTRCHKPCARLPLQVRVTVSGRDPSERRRKGGGSEMCRSLGQSFVALPTAMSATTPPNRSVSVVGSGTAKV
jgi:hypothetical protein